MKKLALGLGVSLAFLLVADQIALRTLLGGNRFLGNPVAPFDPPIFAPSQAEKLEKIRAALAAGDEARLRRRFDAELGWCNPPGLDLGRFRYDWAGCRVGTAPLPREKTPGVRRLVLVGCSMTHGDEVDGPDAWASRLDVASDAVEVANLGVSAYGPDQAVMRLERDGLPLGPDAVWLCVLPQSILRATTLYRPILKHWSLDVAFKPRFALLPDGGLELVPNPPRSFEDIPRLLSDQEALLAAFGGRDPWVERWPAAYAPRGSHWSHRSFFARLGLSVLEAGQREVAPWVRDEEGEVFRLMLALFERARARAEEAGAEFAIVWLPGRDDLLAERTEGRPYWDALSEAARARGLTVHDPTPGLDEAHAASPDDFYAPHGHYGAAASRVVATLLAEALSPNR